MLPDLTEYTTTEGRRLAGLVATVNEHRCLGLQQSDYYNEAPGDDHGVFCRRGYRAVVMHDRSAPYSDPNYHLLSDMADRVDVANVAAATKAIVAATAILAMGE